MGTATVRFAIWQTQNPAGANVTRAAELASLASDTQLRRAWRQFGVDGSPSRRRLGSRA